MIGRRSISAIVAAMLVAACSPSPPPGGGDDAARAPVNGAAGPGAGGGAAESDTARIARLERKARALAKAEGCTAGEQCRTAPVGSRPCGGPREYVVYCPASTDSAALFASLEELARAEEEYNRREELVSTCEFRMPPQVVASGGTCRAAPPTPGAELPR